MVLPMENHVIICGFGWVGKKVAEILHSHNIKFVIVELNPETKVVIEELGYQMITGDATSAKTLHNAGVENASALVAAIDNDAKNLFIILTAKRLNNKLFIATRTKDDMVIDKFKEAGADFIVNSLKSATDEIMDEIANG
jgi:voltage-gated potassium channel